MDEWYLDQQIALISRTRNLRSWDNWVQQRVCIVKIRILEWRIYAMKHPRRKSARWVTRLANDYQQRLDNAIHQRSLNGGT